MAIKSFPLLLRSTIKRALFSSVAVLQLQRMLRFDTVVFCGVAVKEVNCTGNVILVVNAANLFCVNPAIPLKLPPKYIVVPLTTTELTVLFRPGFQVVGTPVVASRAEIKFPVNPPMEV